MSFQNQPIQNFIGNGITFPLELSKGRVVVKSGFELIRSSIAIILNWSLSTRFFLCEFGSKLNELLEEPNDDVLQQVIQRFVIDPLNQWENRVYLVSTALDVESDTKINLQLRYRIINSQSEDTYIYPFYRKINT